MKFDELPLGKWFVIDDKKYLKINPIEDKWGNIHLAVSVYGITICDKDLWGKEVEEWSEIS